MKKFYSFILLTLSLLGFSDQLISQNCPTITSVVAQPEICRGKGGMLEVIVTNPAYPGIQYAIVDATGTPVLGPQSSPIFINIPVGNYQAVVGANGMPPCFPVFPGTRFSIVADPLFARLRRVNNVSCYGGNDGQVSIRVGGGGTMGTTITPSNTTALTAGTYQFVVTSNQDPSCPDTINVTITQPDSIQITSLDIVRKPCTDSAMVTIVGEGGTGTLKYIANGDTSATGVFPKLAGQVMITILDSNGCSLDTMINIVPGKSSINLEVNSNSVSCKGDSSAFISTSVSGGVSPYTAYITSLNDTIVINSTNSSTYTYGYPAGEYIVKVVDSLGCQKLDTVVITEPSEILMIDSIVVSNNICNGNGGTVKVVITGGVSNQGGKNYYSLVSSDLSKSYDLRSIDTNITFTGIAADTYNLVVMDSLFCQVDTMNIIITEPLSLTNVIVTPLACGKDTAMVKIIARNLDNTTPFIYKLIVGTDSLVNTTGMFDNVVLGNCTLVVCDTITGCCVRKDTLLKPTVGFRLNYKYTSNVACKGASTGIITSGVIGGISPFDYYIIKGTDTVYSLLDTSVIDINTSEILSAGLYTILAIDSTNCIVKDTIRIKEPANYFTIDTIIIENLVCNDSNGGSLTVSINGTTSGPYGYNVIGLHKSYNNWVSTADTSVTLTGLPSDTYRLAIYNSEACIIDTNFIITEPVSLDSVKTLPLSCGSDTAKFVIYAHNLQGTTPFKYQLVSGTDTITNFTGMFDSIAMPGTFTLLVYDTIANCTVSQVVTVNVDSFQVTLIDSSDVRCKGDSTGYVYLQINGGNTPYTYTLTSASKTDTVVTVNSNIFFGSLLPGRYELQIVDALGCTLKNIVYIQEPSVDFMIDTVIVKDITCKGSSNGQIDITISNSGSTPYRYFITGMNTGYRLDSATVDTTLLLTGLMPDKYFIYVVADNYCFDTMTVEVKDAVLFMTDSIGVINPICGNIKGSILVSVMGGQSPYNYYVINGMDTVATKMATMDTFITVNNLGLGSYSIVVMDSNGCKLVIDTIITQPAVIMIDTVIVNSLACNDTVTVKVTAMGGSSMLIYSLISLTDTVVNTTGIFTNTLPGNYIVAVGDSNMCYIMDTVIISPIVNTLSIGSNVTEITCNTLAAIDIRVKGGTPNYTYNVSGAATYTVDTNITSFTLNTPIAGMYYLTVTDANGCMKMDTVTVVNTSNPILLSSVIATNVSCNTGSNGKIELNIMNGVAPYSYYVMNVMDTVATKIATMDTFITVNNLGSGSYSIVVMDSNGCKLVIDTIITQPAVIMIDTIRVNQNNCISLANVEVVAMGGSSKLMYALVTSSDTVINTTGMFMNLQPRAYQIVVSDSNGCFVTKTLVVEQLSVLVDMSSLGSSVICGALGTIEVSIKGGTPSYTYAITGPVSSESTTDELSQVFTNVPVGTYYVTVTDANGCMKMDTADVLQIGTTLSINKIATTNVDCFGNNTGSASISAMPGVAPYSYYLYNSTDTVASKLMTADTFFIINNLLANIYTVVVKDSNGCIANRLLQISQPTKVVLTASALTVPCTNNSTVTLTANGGVSKYTYSLISSTDTIVNTTGKFANVLPGAYTAAVVDSNGCLDTVMIMIDTQNLLQVNTNAVNVICNAANTGSISINVPKGTAPYQYELYVGNSIFPSAAYQIIDSETVFNNLLAGGYRVVVLDFNGCEYKDSVTILEPTALQMEYVVNNRTCDTMGAIKLNASGGTNGYMYELVDGADTTRNASGIFTNLVEGSYTIRAVDSLGCSVNKIAVITNVGVILDSVYLNEYACPSQNPNDTVVAYLQATGGVAPYLYTAIVNGDTIISTTGIFTNLGLNFELADTINWTIVDSLGCTYATTTILPRVEELPIVVTADTTLCFGDTTSIMLVGGTSNGIVNTYHLYNANDSIVLRSILSANDTVYFYGVPAGAYRIHAHQVVTCTPSRDFHTFITIKTTNSLAIRTAVIANNTCNGDSAGAIRLTLNNNQPATVAAIGIGTSPANAIANAQVFNPYVVLAQSQVFNNLPADTYYVYVKDTNECGAIAIAGIVTQPTAIDFTSVNVTPTSNCLNQNAGSIAVTAQGGTAPYNYYLTKNTTIVDSSTVGSFDSLALGIYTVNAVDANGCSKVLNNIIISSVQGVIIDSIMVSPVLCEQGDSTASRVMVYAQLGVAPYTYKVINGTDTVTSTNRFVYGLLPNNYTVIVTDATGCTATQNIVITTSPCLPKIGIAKAVSNFVANANGTYDITYKLTVRNHGTTSLHNIQVVDNLRSTFPNPITIQVVGLTSAGNGLVTNPVIYDGISNTSILNSTASTLAIGAADTLYLTVRINPNGRYGRFDNTAFVSGTGPNNNVITRDNSHIGLNDDPDGDNNPDEIGENNPTPVFIPYAVAQIGIAKEVIGTPSLNADGSYSVHYQMHVSNLGTVQLDSVQVYDNLSAAFPTLTYTIQSVTASGNLTVNPAYNGNSNTAMLFAQSSNIDTNETNVIDLIVNVFLPVTITTPVQYNNTAFASATSFGNIGSTSDNSDNGNVSDGNGNRNPDEAGENDPTPIILTPNKPVIGINKLVYVTPNTDGSYNIKYVIKVQNLGIVALTNVQVEDSLPPVFGTSNFNVIAGSVQSTNFTVNNSYAGTGSAVNLLAGTDGLAVGASGTIEFTVRLEPNGYYGPYNNLAEGHANGVGGLGYTEDYSNNGAIDTNQNGIANELIDNNPTVFSLVKPIIVLFIPEGISPNADGINDKLVIEGVPVGVRVELLVYNRWGNIVYQSVDYQNDWNGVATEGIVIGDQLPDGTYWIIVKLSDGSSEIVRYITIKR